MLLVRTYQLLLKYQDNVLECTLLSPLYLVSLNDPLHPKRPLLALLFAKLRNFSAGLGNKVVEVTYLSLKLASAKSITTFPLHLFTLLLKEHNKDLASACTSQKKSISREFKIGGGCRNKKCEWVVILIFFFLGHSHLVDVVINRLQLI